MRRALAALVLVLLVAAGFVLIPGRREQQGPLVLAAASMQEALEAAADAWAAEGNARPVLSFAGTPALARQIEAGAPADLFISADQQWMDELAREGKIRPGTRATFLGNRLVVVELATKHTELTFEPQDALARTLGKGRLAMADPESVPAGRYARQALTSLHVWQDVKPHIVRAENVRLAQALVSQSEAPLGIVYETDARAEPRLRVVATFPETSHLPITYPLALLKTSSNRDAQAFRRFLLSARAAAIFRQFGFTAEIQR